MWTRGVPGLVVLQFMAGCVPSGPDTGSGDAMQPDWLAIAVVVKDVYRQEGRSRIVFLGCESDALDETALEIAENSLEQDLGITVRLASEVSCSALDQPLFTPVLAGTGELGIGIQFGPFRDHGDGTRTVTIL